MPRQLILGEAKDHKKSTAEVLSTFDGAKVLQIENAITVSLLELCWKIAGTLLELC